VRSAILEALEAAWYRSRELARDQS
jgi:hypothetical protein